MDIRVGDLVTYKYLGAKHIKFITDRCDITELENKLIEILKIERPHYEVVEEKKELLTEEEKEFLKQYIKMSPFNIKYIKKEFSIVNDETTMITLNDGQGSGVYFYCKINYFKNLEENKKYTLEELELEKK